MVDRSPAGGPLVSIRRDLEEIDRAIVRLVAARVDAAGRAIRYRFQVDGRVEDAKQEARVLARAQAWGRSLGLAPELTDTIFRAMIASGKQRFAAEVRPARPAKPARARGRSHSWAASRVPSPPTIRLVAPASP